MIFVTYISNYPSDGFVLREQIDGFFTYDEAKKEVERLYRESE